MTDKRIHSAFAQSGHDIVPAGSSGRHIGCMPAALWRIAVNLKTALLAVTAAAALIGAAIISVPTTSDKVTEPTHASRPSE
jgi:hypothetical protein